MDKVNLREWIIREVYNCMEEIIHWEEAEDEISVAIARGKIVGFADTFRRIFGEPLILEYGEDEFKDKFRRGEHIEL